MKVNDLLKRICFGVYLKIIDFDTETIYHDAVWREYANIDFTFKEISTKNINAITVNDNKLIIWVEE